MLRLDTEKQKQKDTGRNVRTINTKTYVINFNSGPGGPADMAVQSASSRVDLGQTLLSCLTPAVSLLTQ